MFEEEYVQIFNVSQSLVFFLPSEGILKVYVYCQIDWMQREN